MLKICYKIQKYLRWPNNFLKHILVKISIFLNENVKHICKSDDARCQAFTFYIIHISYFNRFFVWNGLNLSCIWLTRYIYHVDFEIALSNFSCSYSYWNRDFLIQNYWGHQHDRLFSSSCLVFNTSVFKTCSYRNRKVKEDGAWYVQLLYAGITAAFNMQHFSCRYIQINVSSH